MNLDAILKAEGILPSVAEIGTKYGKLGTIVEKPEIGVISVPKQGHSAQRFQERGIDQPQLDKMLDETEWVLIQDGGKKHLFLSEHGAVVLKDLDKVVTAYTDKDFDDVIIALIAKLKGSKL